jgi:hypothetical protein
MAATNGALAATFSALARREENIFFRDRRPFFDGSHASHSG